MSATLVPTLHQIEEVFEREIGDLGGQVSDRYLDQRRLYLRSILPAVQEVKPGDGLQGGVALRVCDEEVLLHPYVFRQVCRNGAIVAQALQTRRLERTEFEPEEVLEQLQETVQACAAAEVFDAAVDGIRSTVETTADFLLTMLPALAHVPREWVEPILADIENRFRNGGDRSRFGLMNAVTSLARDTRNPERRWRLEEMGGGIAAGLKPTPQLDAPAVALRA